MMQLTNNEVLYSIIGSKVLKSKLFPGYAKRFRSLFVPLQPNFKESYKEGDYVYIHSRHLFRAIDALNGMLMCSNFAHQQSV